MACLVAVGVQALGEEDKSRAGGKHRHALLDALAQPLEHPKLLEELSLNRGLPAGKDQAVKGLVQVGGLPELHASLP